MRERLIRGAFMALAILGMMAWLWLLFIAIEWLMS
jgi:hypothetical protein